MLKKPPEASQAQGNHHQVNPSQFQSDSAASTEVLHYKLVVVESFLEYF